MEEGPAGWHRDGWMAINKRIQLNSATVAAAAKRGNFWGPDNRLPGGKIAADEIAWVVVTIGELRLCQVIEVGAGWCACGRRSVRESPRKKNNTDPDNHGSSAGSSHTDGSAHFGQIQLPNFQTPVEQFSPQCKTLNRSKLSSELEGDVDCSKRTGREGQCRRERQGTGKFWIRKTGPVGPIQPHQLDQDPPSHWWRLWACGWPANQWDERMMGFGLISNASDLQTIGESQVRRCSAEVSGERRVRRKYLLGVPFVQSHLRGRGRGELHGGGWRRNRREGAAARIERR
ncbi:hypothetical protein C8R43DRAFT_975891 [Mycena crocata]|nr:hypothetical protein C8R43DRAFT_975891 [Mycena crocata]